MCRSHRRCPGCKNTAGKKKHNERRRLNREVKNEVIEWARENGFDEWTLKELRAESPGYAQQWAKDHGAPERMHNLEAARAAREQAVVASPGKLRSRSGSAGGDRAGADRHPSAGSDVAAAERARARDGDGEVVVRGGARAANAGRRKGAVSRDQGRAPLAEPEVKPSSVGFVQPVVPSAYDMGDIPPETMLGIGTLTSIQGAHPAERLLLDPQVTHSFPVFEGVNDTRYVIFSSGGAGYFKGIDALRLRVAKSFGHVGPEQIVHEAAAWQLAKRMGPEYEALVPACVLRSINGRVGSVPQEVDGKPSVYPGYLPRDVVHDAAFFDMIIANQDRNESNYLADGSRLHLIDHGFTFAMPHNMRNTTDLVEFRLQWNGADLSRKERELCTELADSSDAWGMSHIIGPPRAAALRVRARRALSEGFNDAH